MGQVDLVGNSVEAELDGGHVLGARAVEIVHELNQYFLSLVLPRFGRARPELDAVEAGELDGEDLRGDRGP